MLRWWVPCVFVYLFAVLPGGSSARAQSRMTAHFIDVGQADATLLEFSCGAVLIDAGAQDNDYTPVLLNYLSGFFERRGDLDNTLDLVLITHNHIDHTRALKEVVQNFTVERFIDSGHDSGTGTGNPNWVRRNTTARSIEIRQIADTEISDAGLTGPIIDPIACDDTDPDIRVLAGRRDVNPGWSQKAFKNKNNHSIVVRVDFGESSFLLTGDLEHEGIELLIDQFDETDLLDVDVYQAGHHGSHNATTVDLIEAMSPDIAVVSMGFWTFGRNPSKTFSTFAYGHPRRTVIESLTLAIDRKRSRPKFVMVGDKAKEFSSFRVKDSIYATGWDGAVRISTSGDGRYRVLTED